MSVILTDRSTDDGVVARTEFAGPNDGAGFAAAPRPKFRKLDNDWFVERVIQQYNDDTEEIKPILDMFDELHQAYEGVRDTASGLGKFSAIVNDCRRIIDDTLPIVTKGNPRGKLKPVQVANTGAVRAFDYQMDWWAEQAELRDTHIEGITNKLMWGSRPGKVAWSRTQRYGPYYGWPVVDNILPHNFRMNCGAKDPRDASHVMMIVFYTADEIRRLFPWAMEDKPELRIEVPKQPDATYVGLQNSKGRAIRAQSLDGSTRVVQPTTKGAPGRRKKYPVIEYWSADWEDFNREPGYKKGGVSYIVGNVCGGMRPNDNKLLDGMIPYFLDIYQRRRGLYVGRGLIEGVRDLGQFEARVMRKVRDFVEIGATAWVMDPTNSGMDWDSLQRDGNKIMRRVTYNMGSKPEIERGPGFDGAVAGLRILDEISKIMNRLAGVGKMDFSGTSPKDLPSGETLKVTQYVLEQRIQPIAEGHLGAIKRIYLIASKYMTKCVGEGARRFARTIGAEDAEAMAPYIVGHADGSAVVSFAAGELKDIELDVEVIPTTTSLIDRLGDIEQMQKMLSTMFTTPPPFAGFLRAIYEMFDFSGHDKFSKPVDDMMALAAPKPPPPALPAPGPAPGPRGGRPGAPDVMRLLAAFAAAKKQAGGDGAMLGGPGGEILVGAPPPVPAGVA